MTSPETPKRITFPSRKTSFPIFTADIADGWLQLLNLTFHCGTEKAAEEGGRLAEVLNAVVTVERSDEAEALAPYLDLDPDDLEAHHRRCWGDESEQAERLARAVERLRESAGPQAATLVILGPDEVEAHTGPSPTVSVTFHVVDERVYGSFVLRSVDVYRHWPIEGASLLRMQREVAERVGLPAGSATFILHSAHLRDRDWERSTKALEQWFKRPLPLQVDPSGLFLFGADKGVARAMLLNHEGDRVLWEGAFENPEDLSWYIIDVMPWLLPQHIRYVGQECASLMRAIREGECYLQG
jgi:hypothetical protein